MAQLNVESTEKIEPPNPKIQAVEEALAGSGSRIQAATTELESTKARTTELTDIVNSAMGDVTVNQQTVARTRMNGELQQQNANINILEAAGGTDKQVELMRELLEEEETLDRRHERTNEIWDGDGNFIGKIFRSMHNQAVIQQRTKERDQTLTQINNITGAQEAFARTNSLTKRTLNEDAIQSNLNIIAAENRIAASEKEIKNMHSNAEAMGRLVAMDNQQVANKLQVARFEQEQEQMKITKLRLKMQQEQLQFQREKMAIELPQARTNLERSQIQLETERGLAPAKRLQLEAQAVEATRQIANNLQLEAQQVEGVQKGQSSTGVPIESSEIIVEGFRKNVPKYTQLRNIGADPLARIGGTPAEANAALRLVDPDNTAVKTVGTRLLDQIKLEQQRRYTELAAKGRVPPKTQEGQNADFNATAQEVMGNLASNITTGAGNPYASPPMASLDAALDNKNIALYEKVIEPMGFKEVDGEALVNAAITGVLAKTITVEQAAEGIAEIFSTAAMYNNTLEGGFARVGLPEQTSYNTTVSVPEQRIPAAPGVGPSVKGVPTGAIFLNAGIKIVDLTDEVAVQEVLVRRLSSETPINPATPQTTPNSPAPKEIQTAPPAQPPLEETPQSKNSKEFFSSIKRL